MAGKGLDPLASLGLKVVLPPVSEQVISDSSRKTDQYQQNAAVTPLADIVQPRRPSSVSSVSTDPKTPGLQQEISPQTGANYSITLTAQAPSAPSVDPEQAPNKEGSGRGFWSKIGGFFKTVGSWIGKGITTVGKAIASVFTGGSDEEKKREAAEAARLLELERQRRLEAERQEANRLKSLQAPKFAAITRPNQLGLGLQPDEIAAIYKELDQPEKEKKTSQEAARIAGNPLLGPQHAKDLLKQQLAQVTDPSKRLAILQEIVKAEREKQERSPRAC